MKTTVSTKSEPLLLRITQVAEMLSISKAKVYAMIADGELPSVRLGSFAAGRRAIRVPRKELLELIASQVKAVAS